MATKKEINQHLKLALSEIGPITPWFDEEVQEWIFCSPLYPVEYAGSSAEEVVENYPHYLYDFIEERLNHNIHYLDEARTKGHGGKREGAGRPVGTRRKPPTVSIRVEKEVAEWLKENRDAVRILAQTSRDQKKRRPSA